MGVDFPVRKRQCTAVDPGKPKGRITAAQFVCAQDLYLDAGLALHPGIRLERGDAFGTLRLVEIAATPELRVERDLPAVYVFGEGRLDLCTVERHWDIPQQRVLHPDGAHGAGRCRGALLGVLPRPFR